MPDLANIHYDVPLTMISIGYTNEAYHADDVFPVVPVDVRSDKYFLYNKDSFLKSSGVDAQGKPRSIKRPGTRSTKVTFDVSTNSYYCETLAKSYDLLDEEVNLADAPLMPAIDATMALSELITLDVELAVATKAMKRGNYASSNKAQLVTSTTSWAASGGKPVSVDIPNAKKGVIAGLVRAATHMLVNYNTAVTLSQNAEYIDKIKYTSRDGLTAGGLAPIIEGLQVMEARAQYANNTEGASVTTGMVWVDDQSEDACLVFYKNPNGAATLRSVHFGLQFESPDPTLHTRGKVIKRWREEWEDKDVIECRTTRDFRFTCTDLSTNGDNANGYATGAYLISGCTL